MRADYGLVPAVLQKISRCRYRILVRRTNTTFFLITESLGSHSTVFGLWWSKMRGTPMPFSVWDCVMSSDPALSRRRRVLFHVLAARRLRNGGDVLLDEAALAIDQLERRVLEYLATPRRRAFRLRGPYPDAPCSREPPAPVGRDWPYLVHGGEHLREDGIPATPRSSSSLSALDASALSERAAGQCRLLPSCARPSSRSRSRDMRMPMPSKAASASFAMARVVASRSLVSSSMTSMASSLGRRPRRGEARNKSVLGGGEETKAMRHPGSATGNTEMVGGTSYRASPVLHQT